MLEYLLEWPTITVINHRYLDILYFIITLSFPRLFLQQISDEEPVEELSAISYEEVRLPDFMHQTK